MLQQLHAGRRSVIDAMKTLWECRVNTVGTLWGPCVHAKTGNMNILGVFRGDPTAADSFSERCKTAVAWPVWCERGFNQLHTHTHVCIFVSDNWLVWKRRQSLPGSSCHLPLMWRSTRGREGSTRGHVHTWRLREFHTWWSWKVTLGLMRGHLGAIRSHLRIMRCS